MHSQLAKANTLFDSLSLLQMGALDSKEEFDTFYVAAAEARNAAEGDRTIKTLLSIEASKRPCHILYSGHMGCGKSTELRRLCHELKGSRFIVGIGVCDENLDMTTMQHTDLILFIMETLLKCANDNNIQVSGDALANIEDYWKDERSTTIDKTSDASLAVGVGLEAKTPNLLAKVLLAVGSARSDLRIQSEKRDTLRRKIEPDLNTFIGMVNDLIDSIRAAGANKGFRDAPPVILLDQLEKVGKDVAADLFEKHSQDLTRLRSSLVLPFPIEMCYTPSYNMVKNYYTDEWILPMVKLRTWSEQHKGYEPYEKGKETLRAIIHRRMADCLFSGNTLDMIIEKTGGFLRDLFRVVYDAALNAIVRQGKSTEAQNVGILIEAPDAMAALANLQSSITRRFPDSCRERLGKIKNGEKRYAFDEELMMLLRSGAVFEYNGERWVDLHPLVSDWLGKTRKPED